MPLSARSKDMLQIAGVSITAIALLVTILRPKQAPVSGESIPELLGSTGSTGTPTIDPPATYTINANGQPDIGSTGIPPAPVVNTDPFPYNYGALVAAQSNPGAGGCCNGSNGTQYAAGPSMNNVPLAQALPTPVSPAQDEPYSVPTVVGTYSEYNGPVQMNYVLMSDGSTKYVGSQELNLTGA
jgi:hypothetical protein